MAINAHETAQVARANDSGRVPVVFIHGLWLLPSSWDRWAAVFSEAGYAPLTQSPPSLVKANARRHERADYVEFPGRCHFSLGQEGRTEIADTILAWAREQRSP